MEQIVAKLSASSPLRRGTMYGFLGLGIYGHICSLRGLSFREPPRTSTNYHKYEVFITTVNLLEIYKQSSKEYGNFVLFCSC